MRKIKAVWGDLSDKGIEEEMGERGGHNLCYQLLYTHISHSVAGAACKPARGRPLLMLCPKDRPYGPLSQSLLLIHHNIPLPC